MAPIALCHLTRDHLAPTLKSRNATIGDKRWNPHFKSVTLLKVTGGLVDRIWVEECFQEIPPKIWVGKSGTGPCSLLGIGILRGASAGYLRASVANCVCCLRVNCSRWCFLMCPLMPFGGIQVVFGHAVQRRTP